MAIVIKRDEEKWLRHYSSNHQILLVGEGDFSFSLSLAMAFVSGRNIVASSFDSYEDLIKMYKKGNANLKTLEMFGATVLHRVDATKMKRNVDLVSRRFDRIIFNFPHAGFRGRERNIGVIRRHRRLINNFFSNAKSMLRPDGEIHVNHKTTPPFSDWKLSHLASANYLKLTQRVAFKMSDYPSYKPKRGDGRKCDRSFTIGKSCTFKFRLSLSQIQRARENKARASLNSLRHEAMRACSLESGPDQARFVLFDLMNKRVVIYTDQDKSPIMQ